MVGRCVSISNSVCFADLLFVLITAVAFVLCISFHVYYHAIYFMVYISTIGVRFPDIRKLRCIFTFLLLTQGFLVVVGFVANYSLIYTTTEQFHEMFFFDDKNATQSDVKPYLLFFLMSFWLLFALSYWFASMIDYINTISQIGSGNVTRGTITVVPRQGSVSKVKSQNTDVQHTRINTNIVNIMDVE